MITTFGIVGALYLGAWAFETRRQLTHQRRLTELLAHAPTEEQVEQAFRNEGTLLLGAAADAAGLRALGERLAGPRSGAVLSEGSAFARTRAYAAGDMVYFIHFDALGVMRGFSVVSRRRGD